MSKLSNPGRGSRSPASRKLRIAWDSSTAAQVELLAQKLPNDYGRYLKALIRETQPTISPTELWREADRASWNWTPGSYPRVSAFQAREEPAGSRHVPAGEGFLASTPSLRLLQSLPGRGLVSRLKISLSQVKKPCISCGQFGRSDQIADGILDFA